MRYLVAFLLTSSLVLLTACDPIYGIRRRSQVAFMPAPGLVELTISNASGVDRVVLCRSPRPEFNPPIEQGYAFDYYGGTNIRAVVQFNRRNKHVIEYVQSLMMMHRPPPQAWVDATQPVMLEIERGLEQRCGLTNLQSSVVEERMGVK